MQCARANGQLHTVLYPAGRLDADRLARAVRLTLDAEPVLGCGFVTQDPRVRRPFWQRCEGLDASSAFRLAETDRTEAALWAFITEPMDHSEGPQVQVRLFRDGQRDTACIKISHVAADVGGMKHYAYLLAATYGRLETDPTYRPARNLSGRRDQRQVYGPLGPRGWLRGLEPRWGAPTWPDPYENAGRNDWRYAVRRLPAEDFRALRAYGRAAAPPDLRVGIAGGVIGDGRARGATVNDLLLTALFRALRATLRPTAEQLGMTVPMDLRRYLPGGEADAVCNLTGVLFSRAGPRPRRRALRRDPGADGGRHGAPQVRFARHPRPGAV